METESQVTPPTEEATEEQARPTAKSSELHILYYFFSGALIVAALIFCGKGLYTLYNDSYSARIVGGDAYNYIIYATRGTALVCAGVMCSVLSVTFALFARAARSS